MYRLYCFEYGNAWSILEQVKKLQYFLLDKVAKLTGVVRNIQKISPNSLSSTEIFFGSLVGGSTRSAVMQSIVLLIILLCFQVELG